MEKCPICNKNETELYQLEFEGCLIVGWIKQILLFLIDITLPYRNSKYFYREQIQSNKN